MILHQRGSGRRATTHKYEQEVEGVFPPGDVLTVQLCGAVVVGTEDWRVHAEMLFESDPALSWTKTDVPCLSLTALRHNRAQAPISHHDHR